MKPIFGLFACLMLAQAAHTFTSHADLVDAGCFQHAQKKTNPEDVDVPGAQNVRAEVRACYPKPTETKVFMLALPGHDVAILDPASNAQALQLVNGFGDRKGRHRVEVNVTGTIDNNVVHLDSITAVK